MKSWANLGGDKSEKEGNMNDTNATTLTKSTTATMKIKEKGKKTKEKTKEKSKKKEEKKLDRNSSSSFEAGMLSPPGSPLPTQVETISRKPSRLALGGLLPSTLRLGTARSLGERTSSTSSTASGLAIPVSPTSMSGNSLYGLANVRLSASSTTYLNTASNGRPSSGYSMSSQGSSLRPTSTVSGMSQRSGMSASAFSIRSGKSSSSSVASVRWDEEGLAGVKEMQRRERQEQC